MKKFIPQKIGVEKYKHVFSIKKILLLVAGATLIAILLPIVAVPSLLQVFHIQHAAAPTPTPQQTSPRKLTWSPPQLTNPITINLTTTHQDLNLDNTKDYILKFPSTPISGVFNEYDVIYITGGHNIVMIGGEISVPDLPDVQNGVTGNDNQRQAMRLDGQTGTVFIEGLEVSGTCMDFIDITAPLATVIFQNVRVEQCRSHFEALSGGYTDEHPDLIQPWGGAAEIDIDGFTGFTDYQGFQLGSDLGLVGNIVVKHANIGRINNPGLTQYGRYYMWMDCHAPGCTDNHWDLTDDSFYIQPADNVSLGHAVWPDMDAASPKTAVLAPDGQSISWPNYTSSINGRVRLGTPATGDFVPAGSVGIGYVSPGYQGQVTPTSTSTSSKTATIITSPSTSSVTVGVPFSVSVAVNGGEQAFNAAQATVGVSSNLSITSLSTPATGGCNFTYVSGQAPTVANPSFAGAILSSSSTNCTVYTLTLTPLSAGTGTISLSNGSVKAYSDNSEILSSVQNGTYTIASAATPTPTTVPPTVTPTPTPGLTNTPTPTSVPPTATPIPTATPTPTPTTGSPSPTPTSVSLSTPTINGIPSDSYQSTLTLSGGRDQGETTIYVNSSTAGMSYPTATTWQALSTSLSIGNNSFSVYGKDGSGNQSGVATATINRHKMGDINGDGVIDLTDLSLFGVDWAKSANLSNPLSDMNGDNIVDLTDFSILAKQYGL